MLDNSIKTCEANTDSWYIELLNNMGQDEICAWSKTKLNTYRWQLIASDVTSDPTVIAGDFASDFASDKSVIASDVASDKPAITSNVASD